MANFKNTVSKGTDVNPHIAASIIVLVLLIGVGWLGTKYNVQLRAQITGNSVEPAGGLDLLPHVSRIMTEEGVEPTFENYQRHALLLANPPGHQRYVNDEADLRAAIRAGVVANLNQPITVDTP